MENHQSFPKELLTRSSRLLKSYYLLSTFLLLTGLCGVCYATPTFQLPTYTTCYTSGAATCVKSGSVLTITQTSPQLIGSWSTFVVSGAGATVHFDQPAGGTALIRIPSGSSQLAGTFTATGTVILISPDGAILNGTQLQGGLVASTLALSDADYTAGNLDSSYFTGSTGTVQIGGSGVSGAASGNLRLLAATHTATGAVDLAGFTLGKGVWTQNTPVLSAFSAANFRIDALPGTQFLRTTGGDGTAGSPYLLADVYGLQGVTGAFAYKLATDIDATGTRTWSRPAGQSDLTNEGFTPIASFSGTLDGDNHTLSNLYILNMAADTGLVGIATGATFANLNLTGVTVTGSSLRTGGLAGLIEESTTVTNCRTSGAVTGASQVGGLVGWSQASSITDSSSLATVSGNISVGGLVGDAGAASSITRCEASGAVEGTQAVGGLVGSVGTDGATISQSAASGAVVMRSGSAGRYVGGLVGAGNAASTIVNTYATGAVTGSVSVGGLVGDGNVSIAKSHAVGAVTGVTGTLGSSANVGGLLGSGPTASATGSFWNTETTGQTSSAAGVGKNTAQMRQQNTFTAASWDFSSIWAIAPAKNSGFPYLKWQTLPDATVNITIATNPAGKTVTVDGTDYTAPRTFIWVVGSSHAITAPNQNENAGTRDAFASWSDGGVQSHSITVPYSDATYTATFGTQYQLTTTISNGTMAPASGGWFAGGATVTVTAYPTVGYTIASWNDGGVPVSTIAATINVIMGSAPKTVTALLNSGQPVLNAGITGRAGTTGGTRIWTISLTNLATAAGPAANARFDSLTVVQTYPATGKCVPAVGSLPAIGSLNIGETKSGTVNVNFTGCLPAARFTATFGFSDNGNTAGSRKLYNQYQ